MIHYLTVQDVLWINQEVTKEVNDFKYAQLEEATYAQYAYGKSKDVLTQAGQFLERFMRLKPFTNGNRATAFVATLTFLLMNDYNVVLDPGQATEWALGVAERRISGRDAVAQIAVPRAPSHIKPVVRTIVHDIIEKYAETVAALREG
jgi:prophage maintenance system killer protein